MNYKHFFPTVLLATLLAGGLPVTAGAATASYVIEISVDGLGSPYLESLTAGGQLPSFQRMEDEGVWTLNARCDYDRSVTLPNHVSMVTGRGVFGTGSDGHNWSTNPSSVLPTETIQGNNGGVYVPSVFDAAHDAGLTTGLFVGKPKLQLLDNSYGTYGQGGDKIDTFDFNATMGSGAGTLLNDFTTSLSTNPRNYNLIHFRDPDAAGSWGSTNYLNAVKTVDGYLGNIITTVQNSPTLAGKTTIIVTADHGGMGNDHSVATAYSNYTIPMIVWGAGASANKDLYAINTSTRTDPGIDQKDYKPTTAQPIRNSDVANLALRLLGKGPISGSTVNAAQNLAVQGVGAAPPKVFAYSAFNEATIGVKDWTPGAGNTELGFTTQVIAGPYYPNATTPSVLATYDSASSPRRFRMMGYEGKTTFSNVDLTDYHDVAVSIDILVKKTPYESDDYYKAVLTNGVDTVALADVQLALLADSNKDVFLHYSASIPDSWTEATLQISSHTNSSTNAEAVDFDNIFFSGIQVPEPTTVTMGLMGALVLAGFLARRRWRR